MVHAVQSKWCSNLYTSLCIIQCKDAVPGLLKVGSVLKGTRPVALMELVPLRRSLTSLLNKVLAQNSLKGGGGEGWMFTLIKWHGFYTNQTRQLVTNKCFKTEVMKYSS